MSELVSVIRIIYIKVSLPSLIIISLSNNAVGNYFLMTEFGLYLDGSDSW